MSTWEYANMQNTETPFITRKASIIPTARSEIHPNESIVNDGKPILILLSIFICEPYTCHHHKQE